MHPLRRGRCEPSLGDFASRRGRLRQSRRRHKFRGAAPRGRSRLQAVSSSCDRGRRREAPKRGAGLYRSQRGQNADRFCRGRRRRDHLRVREPRRRSRSIGAKRVAMNDDATKSVWRIEADSEAATAAIAADLASLLRGGDVVALSGDLGVGKTVFARGLIRAIAKDPAMEAPSPSFTLMEVYEGDYGKIVHADFYRIEAVHELAELGWEDVVQDAIVVVEWPERSKEIMDADHLDVALSYASEIGPNARIVTIAGHGAFAKRLEAFKSLREFLRQAGWDDAHRAFLQGDASS